MDSFGPLARSVEDAALIYQAIQGCDAADQTTLGLPVGNVLDTLKKGIDGLRLVFAESLFWDDIHPDIDKAVRNCGEVFESLGAEVGHADFKIALEAQRLNANGLVISAEACEVNSRWLGKSFRRNGSPGGQSDDQGEPGAGGKLPAFSSSVGNDFRARLCRTWRQSMRCWCPLLLFLQWRHRDLIIDHRIYADRNIALLRNTAIGNILNLCGLSVPCGFTAAGLPVGLMIYAKPLREDLLLRIGDALPAGN